MGARDNGGKAEPQARDEARRWALVGAYERGNMGDILLLRAPNLLLTRPGRELIRAAPFAPAPGAMAPEGVVRWSDELSARSAEVMWTIGGAVGAVSPQRAEYIRNSSCLVRLPVGAAQNARSAARGPPRRASGRAHSRLHPRAGRLPPQGGDRARHELRGFHNARTSPTPIRPQDSGGSQAYPLALGQGLGLASAAPGARDHG